MPEKNVQFVMGFRDMDILFLLELRSGGPRSRPWTDSDLSFSLALTTTQLTILITNTLGSQISRLNVGDVPIQPTGRSDCFKLFS